MDRLDPRWMRRYQVTEVLKEFSNKSVFYFPNPGNAGDSLISVATMQLFKRLNITFKPVGLDAKVEGQVVILGGGGNFIPLYTAIRTALERFSGKAKRIILLPHTIRGNEDVIAFLPSNAILMCRDAESYQHVLNINPKCEVMLTHDMAFHLDTEELYANIPDPDHYQQNYTEKLQLNNLTPRDLAQKPESYFFRRDTESTGRHPTTDLDLSAAFTFGVWPRKAELASWCFLEAIRTSQSVATDRLHVAIASALLGKPCRLHDNSYGKNRVVFQHSLRSWSSVSFLN